MKPLDGVTILDLSRVLACPFASMILAELGATVIKVEQPEGGDETRGFEPKVHGEGGDESAYYLAFNRSKQSITVNFRKPEGQALIRRLAQDVDVVVENFPVGTLARYGLDKAHIAPENADLIYFSCTGFGMTGPYAARKGYDTVFQAMGGIMSLTGERGRGPVKPGLPVADLTSGLWAAIGILSALVGRERSGRGCHVDFSMLDGQVGLLSLAAARYFALGEVPPRMGTEHPGRVPSAAFECRDGKWVQITGSDQHWKPLCDLLDLPQWSADEELARNAVRVARREEVMAGLQAAVAKLDRDELCRRCDAAGVPAGPILDVGEILNNEHVLARGMVASYEHPHIGRFGAVPVPFKFEGYEDPQVERPPLLGEHTDEVLRARLGLSNEEITALRQLGAI
ncbi:Formyl-coenzyme A transferase [compost metagenome]|uniref:CaiB/BaiF CoA transferase family protein n=1 Tax=Achromobacter sp. TaxID=134375 RepID=UPI000FB8BC94